MFLLALPAGAAGTDAPHRSRRPSFDASAPASLAARVPLVPGAADHPLLQPGSPLHAHPAFGVPTFVRAARHAPPAPARGPRIARDLSVAAARAHLARFAALYRLEAADLAALADGAVHDTGRGAVIVALQGRADGLEIFREEVRVAMDRDLALIALSGFVTGSGSAWGRSGRRRFTLDAPAAAAAALADLTGREVAARDLRPGRMLDGGYLEVEPVAWGPGDGEGLSLPDLPRVKRLLFRLPGRLEPAYYVEVSAADAASTDADRYAYVISAADGSVLFRHDQTVQDAYTYRVWADAAGIPQDGPQGNDPTPHPTGLPDRFQAPFIPPSLITLQNGPISTSDPWLPAGASATSGNNVDAYADLASPDGFSAGDLRAATTSGNTFDRTYDTGAQPNVSSAQRMAAVTQLFYDVNFLHDWFYDSGFDEISGNAQTSNYGRGGLQGDAMRAEAQDHGGRNNANMSTPADGGVPRMQMYIFDGNGRRKLTIGSPASIAGVYAVGSAEFGPKAFSTTGQMVLVNDGAGTASDACTTPFVNAGTVAGRIALVDRGTCTFVLKVKNAQLNGAIGVVVANNVATGALDMSGTDATVTIPSLFVSLDDGNAIRAELGAGVTASLLREAAIDRDGTIDNQIVAHEWGHYISNRLIGNASGLSNQQGGGLGEGWGDFHALLMSVRAEDATHPAGAGFTGAYALAGYVTSGGGNDGGDNNGYYFGIRRYPYATDFARNPLTFRHISNGVALPAGVPVEGDTTGSANAEVHNVGEVWATMLWESYAALLRDSGRLTFDEARGRMSDYLVAAYKLTPSSPTLIEARDALLAAAWAFDPRDHALFLQAFARRGAGHGAVAPDRYSLDLTGVVESYEAGGELVVESAALDDGLMSCDLDGILDGGEAGRLTVTLRNAGAATLNSTTANVTSVHPDVSFPGGAVLSFPPSAPLGTTTASVDVRLGQSGPGIEVLTFGLEIDDPGFVLPGPVRASWTTRGHVDDVPMQSATDDVESPGAVWSPGGSGGFDPARGWRRAALSATSHLWQGPDPGSISDQWLVSPPLQVASSGSFRIGFSHRHAFESSGSTHHDGGVMEISTDGGASWSDIGALASPGYNGAIAATGGGNPLEGRPAWVGASAGYPAFSDVSVLPGSSYAGQTVHVRFRIGTDVGAGGAGWEIDDIVFEGITNLPFAVLLPEAAMCSDTDFDGQPDPRDCAPLDGSAWAAPGEAFDLQLEGHPTTLSWIAPAAPGATTPLYDVLRSPAAADFGLAACLESSGTDRTASDPALPGAVFHYLIRVRNACGETLGSTSSGIPRTGAPCP